jgi:hypothetical protein
MYVICADHNFKITDPLQDLIRKWIKAFHQILQTLYLIEPKLYLNDGRMIEPKLYLNDVRMVLYKDYVLYVDQNPRWLPLQNKDLHKKKFNMLSKSIFCTI